MPRAPRKTRPKVEAIRSIPEDVVLAPQAEVPRNAPGGDRSNPRQSRLRELSWADFDRIVHSLAREVQAAGTPDAVLGVAHGGVFVGGAIARALGCDFFPVRISRRSRDKLSQRPRLTGEIPKELAKRDVLVADDVASSGETLELARALLEKVGAKRIRTLTLLSRTGGYEPDHVALPSDELTVFPWDYDVVEDARFLSMPDAREPSPKKAKPKVRRRP